MSVHWISWAWEQRCKDPSEKLVLLCLADHAGHDGSAYPGTARLAEFTGLGERQVRRHLDTLDDRGVLTRERRRRKDGTLGTYRYTLLATTGHPRPQVTHDRDQRTPMSGSPPDTHVRAEPSLSEPSLEPNPHAHPADERGRFDEFWKLYPRKVGKTSATKRSNGADGAFDRALKRASFDEIMAGLAARVAWWERAGTPRDKMPHPATWLNESRWLDELEPVPKQAAASLAQAAASNVERQRDEVERAVAAGDGELAWRLVVQRASSDPETLWWWEAAQLLDRFPDDDARVAAASGGHATVEQIAAMRAVRDKLREAASQALPNSDPMIGPADA